MNPHLRQLLQGNWSDLLISIGILHCIFFSEFKQDLLSYTLEYSSNLTDYIVKAREPGGSITNLFNLVEDHSKSQFNDKRV